MVIGLSGHYGKLGVHVGARPYFFISIAVLLSCPAFFGLYYFPYLDQRLSEQFIEPYAQSLEEVKAQKTFFNLHGEPWYMAVFAIAKDGKNMLDLNIYGEAAKFYESTLSMNLTSEGERFNFSQLCKPLCGINDQLTKLMDYAFFATIRWPVSQIMGYNVNIGKHFFNRTVNPTTGELEKADILALYYTAMQSDHQSTEKLRVFEREVARLAEIINNNNGSSITLVVHGTNTVGEQIKTGFEHTAFFIGLGVLMSTLAYLILFFVSAKRRECFSLARLGLALVSTSILSFLAIATGVGYTSLCGYSLNLLFIISPIVPLFFLNHFRSILYIFSTFDDQQPNAKRSQWNRVETLGALFERIGPVHLLTSLVPVLALLSSSFFVSPGYASLLITVGTALFFQWIYQIFIVCPLLTFTLPKSNKQYQSPEKKISTASFVKAESACNRSCIQPYSVVLSSGLGKVTGFLLLGLLLGTPVRMGLENLRSDMNFRSILKDDAPAFKGFELVDKMWNDFHQIIFFIRSPPDFSNEQGYTLFRKFIDDAEDIPNSHHPSAHQSWIFDYFPTELAMDYNSENATLFAPDMKRFDHFINGFPYDAWKDGVKYRFADENKTKPIIDRMVVMMAYDKVKGLDGKRQLLKQCRRVVTQNPQLNAVAFDTDSINVDIIENVLPTFYVVLIAFIISTFTISFFVLFNFVMSVLATLGTIFVIATSLGITLLVSNFYFDLMTLSSYILITVFSIQVSLTFVGDFLTVWAHENRVQRALASCGSNVFKALFLTVLLFGPLTVCHVQLFRWQAFLALFGTLSGVLSAIFVQPLIGGVIPTKLISQECCI
ncbi:unnamed protein product [Bursaphelenchus okinawaensis]|uniref:SSD domain-containing protein n=1 Tax=Bursaphelenchus okinawaensis TaxID=465554 RepID=A0A811LLV2_9BILA|nr:unnamed protein product [Bursaphelenchus okinawaensis]CAG9124823.1 unnamed protein product [Bursaphelenchus okinawaensis]